jgi:hypothetical protein
LAEGKRPKGFTPTKATGEAKTPKAVCSNPLFADDDDDFLPRGARAYTVGYECSPARLSAGNLVAHYRKHVLRVPSQDEPGDGPDPLPDSPDAKPESPYASDSDDRRQTMKEERAQAKEWKHLQAGLEARAKWRPGESSSFHQIIVSKICSCLHCVQGQHGSMSERWRS